LKSDAFHHAAGATWSPLDLKGPRTACPERSEGFRALAHAPISSALSPNRYRTSPSSSRTCSAISVAYGHKIGARAHDLP